MTKSGGSARKHKHKKQRKKSFFLKLYFFLTLFFYWTFAFKIWNYRKQASLRLPEKIIDRKFAYYALAKILHFNFIFKTLFFFSIPLMPYPLHPKPHLSSPKNVVIWSFGHFAVFRAWLLGLSLIDEKKTDHLMKRKTEHLMRRKQSRRKREMRFLPALLLACS